MKADSGLPAPYQRVVLDTNVLLSAALLPHGVPAQLLDRLLAEGQLVFSAATFAELEARLWKPKFDRYLSIDLRRRLLHDFRASALWVDVSAAVAAVRNSRDVADDAFIHAAQCAAVGKLVSGDADLLVLDRLENLHIISPRDAWGEISAGMTSSS